MKRVLISLEIPDLAPWNRFSAVACVVCSFAEILHNNKYEVFINQYPFQKVLEEINNGSKAKGATGQPSRMVRLFPKRLREMVKDILLFRKLNTLYKMVQANPRPDIIISWVSYASANGVKLAKHWRVPLLSIYDNPLVEEYAFQLGYPPFFKFWIERQEARMVTGSHKLILYSPAMAEMLSKKYGKTIPHSFRQFIDRYKINFLEKERSYNPINFLYVGSFFEWHRVDLLIAAFHEVCQVHDNCHLYLVGGGPQQEKIEKQVKDLRLSNYVSFEGFKDKDALRQIMENSHIGVIPSALWFHAPVKLFQYAAAGLCILATKTPTIQFIQEQDNSGIQLFASRDELILQMKRMATEPETIGLYGNTSLRWIKTLYSDQEYLQYFEGLFKEAGL